MAVAAVNAVGFTSKGIVAGSTAAAMMSANAVAAGGAISSGGLVATLQSFGALGAVSGTAATLVTFSGLAIGVGVGVGAVAGGRAIYRRMNNSRV